MLCAAAGFCGPNIVIGQIVEATFRLAGSNHTQQGRIAFSGDSSLIEPSGTQRIGYCKDRLPFRERLHESTFVNDYSFKGGRCNGGDWES